MSPEFVRLPAINANDSSATLVEWTVEDRDAVFAGDVIAIIETTKAAIEVEASRDGFCAHLHEEGVKLEEGTILAIILETADAPLEPYLEKMKEKTERKVSRMWTRKAELMANKLGVDIVELAEKLGRKVKENDVMNFRDPGHELLDLVDDEYPGSRRQRVLLIGGGGGGGVITLDAIARTLHQRAVGILDNNEGLKGKTLMGVPVIGGNDMAWELWEKKFFDAAIIVVTANIDQREELFDRLKMDGIPLTNVIDPLAEIRANCSLGVGNLIMANCFLAACVKLGDNNFLASHVCIEHHSVVGDHCTFGPRTTTSGAVTIGNRVKFGMGVLVEPYLEIGDDSIIPSGVVLNSSLARASVLKIKRNYTETGR
jgi:acetyltransferase-like isoleucine patch superfamily enzyme